MREMNTSSPMQGGGSNPKCAWGRIRFTAGQPPVVEHTLGMEAVYTPLPTPKLTVTIGPTLRPVAWTQFFQAYQEPLPPVEPPEPPPEGEEPPPAPLPQALPEDSILISARDEARGVIEFALAGDLDRVLLSLFIVGAGP